MSVRLRTLSTLVAALLVAPAALAQAPATPPAAAPAAAATEGAPCDASRGLAAPGKLLERIAASGSLCVGVRNGLPPFSVKDAESGRFEGFEPSLARIVKERVQELLGKPIKLRLVGFDRPSQVLAAVQSGQLDFAVSAITRTRSRDFGGGVDFSVDYFLDRQELLVDKASFKGLAGIKVAVLADSTAQRKWAFRHPEVTLVPCPTHAACIQKLKAGEVQGYGGDRAIILQQAMDAGVADKFKLSGLPEFGDFDDTFWMEPYGVVVPENQSGLRDAVNLAFETAWDNDVVDMLFHLHFGRDSKFKGQITYDLPHVSPSFVPPKETAAP